MLFTSWEWQWLAGIFPFETRPLPQDLRHTQMLQGPDLRKLFLSVGWWEKFMWILNYLSDYGKQKPIMSQYRFSNYGKYHGMKSFLHLGYHFSGYRRDLHLVESFKMYLKHILILYFFLSYYLAFFVFMHLSAFQSHPSAVGVHFGKEACLLKLNGADFDVTSTFSGRKQTFMMEEAVSK